MCFHSTDRRCEVRKVTGSLPPYWKWVGCSDYAGKVAIRGYTYDSWTLPVSIIFPSPLCCKCLAVLLRVLVAAMIYMWTLTPQMFQFIAMQKLGLPQGMSTTVTSILSRPPLPCLMFLQNASDQLGAWWLRTNI